MVLHGDLLPQNLSWDLFETQKIGVVDWEYAQIGDPAYDLAVATGGARKPLKECGGLEKLLATYARASGVEVLKSAVQIHEILMHLHWMDEAVKSRAGGDAGGHGPEHYADGILAMLRRLNAV